MNRPPPSLDQSFIDSQRQKLGDERTRLSSAISRHDNENRQLDLSSRVQASESEDQAQALTLSENNRILVDALIQRRISVERALAKIDNGTYGYSDISDQPIPLARLQAFPEAARTEAEEAAFSKKPADDPMLLNRIS